jgi:hypothetical protein
MRGFAFYLKCMPPAIYSRVPICYNVSMQKFFPQKGRATFH